jgi:hypothetical protein
MKQHWKILLWMIAGVIVGGVLQFVLEARPESGLRVEDGSGGAKITAKRGLANKSKLAVGDIVLAVTVDQGRGDREKRLEVSDAESFGGAIGQAQVGDVVWVQVRRGEKVSGRIRSRWTWRRILHARPGWRHSTSWRRSSCSCSRC